MIMRVKARHNLCPHQPAVRMDVIMMQAAPGSTYMGNEGCEYTVLEEGQYDDGNGLHNEAAKQERDDEGKEEGIGNLTPESEAEYHYKERTEQHHRSCTGQATAMVELLRYDITQRA